MVRLLILLAVTIAVFSVPRQTPVIGIYTQDAPSSRQTKTTYIAASYVKFVEMSGGQVIPLFSNYSQTILKSKLDQINGVIFPGGAMSFNMS